MSIIVPNNWKTKFGENPRHDFEGWMSQSGMPTINGSTFTNESKWTGGGGGRGERIKTMLTWTFVKEFLCGSVLDKKIRRMKFHEGVSVTSEFLNRYKILCDFRNM
jgi:hypothetical protein